jgi:tetratricopeptide (TPR) repeat protein
MHSRLARLGLRTFALLIVLALPFANAHGQYSAQQCAELRNQITAALNQRANKQLIELARKSLTYCLDTTGTEDFSDALRSLAIGLSGDGQYAEAIGIANRCLQVNSSDLGCAFEKGWALFQLGRVREAKATLDRASTQPALTEPDVKFKKAIGKLLTAVDTTVRDRPISEAPELPPWELDWEGGESAVVEAPRSPMPSGASTDVQKFVRAIAEGNETAVRQYLLIGISPNSTAAFGMPALHLAEIKNYPKVMTLLIQHGARLNEKFGPSQRTVTLPPTFIQV